MLDTAVSKSLDFSLIFWLLSLFSDSEISKLSTSFLLTSFSSFKLVCMSACFFLYSAVIFSTSIDSSFLLFSILNSAAFISSVLASNFNWRSSTSTFNTWFLFISSSWYLAAASCSFFIAWSSYSRIVMLWQSSSFSCFAFTNSSFAETWTSDNCRLWFEILVSKFWINCLFVSIASRCSCASSSFFFWSKCISFFNCIISWLVASSFIAKLFSLLDFSSNILEIWLLYSCMLSSFSFSDSINFLLKFAASCCDASTCSNWSASIFCFWTSCSFASDRRMSFNSVSSLTTSAFNVLLSFFRVLVEWNSFSKSFFNTWISATEASKFEACWAIVLLLLMLSDFVLSKHLANFLLASMSFAFIMATSSSYCFVRSICLLLRALISAFSSIIRLLAACKPLARLDFSSWAKEIFVAQSCAIFLSILCSFFLIFASW